MTRLWRKTDIAKEGKYLVQRRDGTIPEWPSFVLGARDPVAVAALVAYADAAEAANFRASYDEAYKQELKLPYDPEYIADVRSLAQEFLAYRVTHGSGDPSAPPHRKDEPEIITKMQKGRGA